MKHIWKKGILTLLMALMVAMAAPSILPSETSMATVEAAKMKINATSAIMIKGQSGKLKIKNATSTVTWSSNKPKVAYVNKKGKVTALKKGTAVITAKVDGQKFKCKIYVENPKISQTSATLTAGDTLKLKISGTSQTVKWASNKTSVATVNQKGKVTAKKAGTATITAKVGSVKYKCKVTVKSGTVAVTGITLNKSSLTLDKGSSASLTATVSPSNATNKTVSWKSSNTSIATVSGGSVTGVSAGTATITATCGNYSASCSVQVKQTYGDLTGEITYYYNNYRGTVGDDTAFVVLIPADGSAKSLTNASDPLSKIYLDPTVYNSYGIYGIRVGGTGSYTINNIPTGDYIVYIRSGNTTAKEWHTDSDAYYAEITKALSPYLSDSVATAFGETTFYYKYAISKVTISKDKTSTLNYDFGISYS